MDPEVAASRGHTGSPRLLPCSSVLACQLAHHQVVVAQREPGVVICMAVNATHGDRRDTRGRCDVIHRGMREPVNLIPCGHRETRQRRKQCLMDILWATRRSGEPLVEVTEHAGRGGLCRLPYRDCVASPGSCMGITPGDAHPDAASRSAARHQRGRRETPGGHRRMITPDDVPVEWGELRPQNDLPPCGVARDIPPVGPAIDGMAFVWENVTIALCQHDQIRVYGCEPLAYGLLFLGRCPLNVLGGHREHVRRARSPACPGPVLLTKHLSGGGHEPRRDRSGWATCHGATSIRRQPAARDYPAWAGPSSAGCSCCGRSHTQR